MKLYNLNVCKIFFFQSTHVVYRTRDKILCCSFRTNYDILTCYERGFDVLAGLSSWWDLFGSRFYVGPECVFCLEEAHMLSKK